MDKRMRSESNNDLLDEKKVKLDDEVQQLSQILKSSSIAEKIAVNVEGEDFELNTDDYHLSNENEVNDDSQKLNNAEDSNTELKTNADMIEESNNNYTKLQNVENSNKLTGANSKTELTSNPDSIEQTYEGENVSERNTKNSKDSDEEQHDYWKYAVAKNFGRCEYCWKQFKKGKRDKIEDICGHTICSKCQAEGKNKPCKMCLTIFDTDSDESSALNFVNANKVVATNWLFNDVKDDSPAFKKPYKHDRLVQETLVNIFHLKEFRSIQLSVINAAMLDENCFVMMPSGGGKSLLYQLPGYLSRGVTIVVSPLRSLIHDQVSSLNKMNIKAEHLIGSEKENDLVVQDLRKRLPLTRIVYLTPERFKTEIIKKLIIQLVQQDNISRLVIDEAHCVVLWGKDFRFAYYHIRNIQRQLLKNVPIMLLTASATPEVRNEILDMVGIGRTNIKYFIMSYNRPNLQYEVECINSQDKYDKVLSICSNDQFSNSSGIIYCISKTECSELASVLQAHGIKAQVYHAGLTETLRVKVQDSWSNSSPDCRIIIATIAFGMGINKSNVRFVVHIGLPKSLEGYYQESGRAGRDEKYALCKLFWTVHDYKIWEETLVKRKSRSHNPKFAEADKKILENQIQMLSSMQDYASNTTECRRKMMLKYYGENFDSALCRENITTVCDNCLKNL